MHYAVGSFDITARLDKQEHYKEAQAFAVVIFLKYC